MDDDSEQSPAATKPISIPGLHWSADGQATLSGPLLRRFEELESLFRGLGEKWNAQEVRFPPLISVGELQRIQYFRSFPHLFTAAVALDGMRDNLEEFTSANSSGAGELRLTRTAAVREILTPAACYHLYVLHQGQRFDRVRYF
ncbi:MAG: hypothetical protein ABI718_13590, partial [Acidobacteriota bacterium]